MNLEGVTLLHWKGEGWYFKAVNNRGHILRSAEKSWTEKQVVAYLETCHPGASLIGYLEEIPEKTKTLHIMNWVK